MKCSFISWQLQGRKRNDMTETREELPLDDAPLSASKRDDAVDRVTEELVEPKGDTLTGRRHDQPAPRGTLRLLARLREPCDLHG
jgi:hypothetical protein